MSMTWNAADVPRPVTHADYLACYEANLREARQKLENLAPRYRAMRHAGAIYQDEQSGNWVTNGKDAAEVYGEAARWRSDAEHWSRLAGEARTAAQAERGDSRLPREVGEDDGDEAVA